MTLSLLLLGVTASHWQRGDLGTIAAINGAVLSIVLAALAIYAAVVVQTMHDMETDLIETARSVNRLSAPVYTAGKSWWDESEPEPRVDMCVRISLLTMGATKYEGSLGEDLPPVDRLDTRLGQATAIFSELCNRPPFPPRVVGYNEGVPIFDSSATIQLDTYSDVVKWHDSIGGQNLGYVVLTATTVSRAWLDDAESQHTYVWTSGGSITDRAFLEQLEAMNPRRAWDNCVQFLQRFSEISDQVAVLRGKSDSYRRRLPRWRIVGATALFGVAFTVGVIVPLIRPSFSPTLASVVPALTYLTTIGFVVVALAVHAVKGFPAK